MKDDCLSLYVNDHKLTGVKKDGKWAWDCKDFPALSKQHDGDTGTQDCILNFMRLCLEPALAARKAWENNK